MSISLKNDMSDAAQLIEDDIIVKDNPNYYDLLENNIILKKEIEVLKEKIIILTEELFRFKNTESTNNHGYWYEINTTKNSCYTNFNVKYLINEKKINEDNILDDEGIKNIYIKYKIPFSNNTDTENDDDNDSHSDCDTDTDSSSISINENTVDQWKDTYKDFKPNEEKLIFHDDIYQNNEETKKYDCNKDDIKLVYIDESINKNHARDDDDTDNSSDNTDDNNSDPDDEVFEKIIDGKKYYVTVGKISKIYDIEEDERAGKYVGCIINNKVYFK